MRGLYRMSKNSISICKKNTDKCIIKHLFLECDFRHVLAMILHSESSIFFCDLDKSILEILV